MDNMKKEHESGIENSETSAFLAEREADVPLDWGVDYAALFREQTGKDFETGEFIVQ